MPEIIHVVQLAFRKDANEAEVDKVLQAFGNLNQACVTPGTNQSYIASLRWGRDVSPEGIQNGFTHMFIVHFHTVKDRDYYLNDPAHQLVVKGLAPVMDKVQVLDIEV